MVYFQPEGEDDLKKMQLMELAILNGTYRDQAKAMIPTLTRKCWQANAADIIMLVMF